ncbi:MAG: histidine--tRNA ligase, partial [Saprospiraceae bacterium]|nr:histidine--tRNA ligase [Saprospiraceae bacterium]
GVLSELERNGIDIQTGKSIIEALSISNLDELEAFLTNSVEGKKGVEELRAFHAYLDQTVLHNKIEFDISLARGLNYYTGCIFEVVSNQVKMGSIGGGGRYDDLTSVFGLKGVSGVGISFGAARIYDIMEELDLFPSSVTDGINVLWIALDEESHVQCFKWVMGLRDKGIASDLYPAPLKLKKQMKYANDIKVPYTIVVGSQELESGLFKLKNMLSGEEKPMNFDQLVNFFMK